MPQSCKKTVEKMTDENLIGGGIHIDPLLNPPTVRKVDIAETKKKSIKKVWEIEHGKVNKLSNVKVRPVE